MQIFARSTAFDVKPQPRVEKQPTRIAAMLRQPIKPLAFVGAMLLTLATNWMIAQCRAATIIGDPVQLSTLTGNPQGQLIVGDKKFTQFGYTATGEMPGAAGVNVVPILDDLGNYGIRFQGLFMDLASSQGGSDALITYDVEVTDPRKYISDAHIQGNPALPGPGRHGAVIIAETFLPLGQNGEYTMTIYDDEGIATPKLVDWVDFKPPVKSLHVQKDIGIIAVAGFASPSFSFVDQTFSQIEVPEPATLMLTLFGMVSLIGCARGRKRQQID
jgi:PEP-CTERM motif